MKDKRKLLSRLLLIIGFTLCGIPLAMGAWSAFHQTAQIATFDAGQKRADPDQKAMDLAEAQEYNSLLYQADGALIGEADSEFYSDKHYNSLLNDDGTGLMGSIEIPKISVNLPIYHGTDEAVLSKGVGHLKGTSLPVGGENTRSILTAHRGLPNSKLFTRLDEMEKGDLIFLNTVAGKMAYEVSEIETIKPEETDAIKICDGEDLITLVTCTPYGINTHRLLVTAKRVNYQETDMAPKLESAPPSWRELIFSSLPFIFVIIGLVYVLKDLFAKRKELFHEH